MSTKVSQACRWPSAAATWSQVLPSLHRQLAINCLCLYTKGSMLTTKATNCSECSITSFFCDGCSSHKEGLITQQ